MKEHIYLKTHKYGDKPLTIRRAVFNQLDIKGFVIGQFRHYRKIKLCISAENIQLASLDTSDLESWYEISYSNPLFYEYMKEQTNEG